ncbi:MAG TPA: rhodanese-like domain-containing protein [Tissierellaceae bacterium]|nr:rhodanese-like domain-containing protein [Tissierellaceae bacterium]
MATALDSTKTFFDDLKDGRNNLIDCENLFKCIGAGEDLFILDIRKKEDFTENFIDGSVHCEWDEVYEFIEEDILPKDKRIIVVCYTGQTAGQTVGILRLLGYDACSLMGGMVNGWLKSDMPFESTCAT